MKGDCSSLAHSAGPDAETFSAGRGQTPSELARQLRVSPDRIRAWIATGELGAINTSTMSCGRPRFVILPEHLQAFLRSRAVTAPPKPAPRRRRPATHDFYPD